ncbi:ABC transporter ATP-binding protein [Lactobacillus sp. M0403]|uniref:ABC transporter ATP-binding protein n=1 Tax=Lactobacillus TaxID=1578 RepID=UPI000D6B67EA|nr:MULTISPECIES: ABC transporter ATP-binding protein [Lactobacillus]AWM73012.1 bacteriocin ABC transporter ATP-binding protein [Lactobacillus apis]MBC6361296.1 ABC transporter ATP-binding protein [Lactobacillus apis]MBI0092534.1 ABC transporter ATP-binding protein [Lactobacillus sp. M0403]
MIELKNITKKFENKTVFANFNLQIDQNEMVAIIGPSGSGKSTLLNILGLIDKVDDGDYQFEQYTNIKPNSRLAQKIIREKISYLFQNFALIEEDTVLQNLLLALKYVKQSKKEKTEIITAALQKVGLSEYLNSKIYELSGGQQQRVAVARAIIKPSELVLADEPTGSLDSKNRDEIIKLLLELNDAGKTVIVVTHDSHVAEKCHRVLELK